MSPPTTCKGTWKRRLTGTIMVGSLVRPISRLWRPRSRDFGKLDVIHSAQTWLPERNCTPARCSEKRPRCRRWCPRRQEGAPLTTSLWRWPRRRTPHPRVHVVARNHLLQWSRLTLNPNQAVELLLKMVLLRSWIVTNRQVPPVRLGSRMSPSNHEPSELDEREKVCVGKVTSSADLHKLQYIKIGNCAESDFCGHCTDLTFCTKVKASSRNSTVSALWHLTL